MSVSRRDLLWAGGALAGLTACGAAPRTATVHPSAAPAGSRVAPSTSSARWPAEISHGPRTRPAVALTFHGQGTRQQVNGLLKTLESGGAHGTILAVGSWLASQPDIAQRILESGHDLGNHTQHHLALTTMAAADVYREIDECAQLLFRLTGSIRAWFRPSQTQHANTVIEAQATRVGYATCLSYDVDSLDYTDPGPAAIVSTTMRHAQAGSIVSLHCGHDGTIAAMPALLEGLATRGLRPVTVTTLLAQ